MTPTQKESNLFPADKFDPRNSSYIKAGATVENFSIGITTDQKILCKNPIGNPGQIVNSFDSVERLTGKSAAMHDGEHRYGNDILLDLTNLKVISALGRGAKGVVFLVQTESGKLLALKSILRSSVQKKRKPNSTPGDDYRRIFFEREVLASFDYPLLPKLHGVVVTDVIVGYAIDYCSGPDLNSLRKLQTEKMFSDDSIRFYAAELVLALEHLHNLGIVYRDLKPENVMVQETGHLMLVDFDLSTKLAAKSPESPADSPQTKAQNEPKKTKKRFNFLFKRRDSGISPDDSSRSSDIESARSSSVTDSVTKSNSFVGTEEYVAPEVIQGHGHDFSVDWWCLGIVLYEMLYGTTPFRGSNRKETFYRVVTKAPNLTGESTPLRDLIGKLLEKDPRKRIAAAEIRRHEFFKGVNWSSLTELPRPPFIPELTDVEGMMGNKKINVESFVQGVFKVEEEDEELNTRNKDAWVQGHGNHPTQIKNDNFLIF